MKLDATNRKLVILLQNDCKQTSKQPSLQLHLSVTYECIEKSEKGGAIKKYVAVMDKGKSTNHFLFFAS